MLEIALFQALTSFNPMVTFAEAEWQFRPSGCIHRLGSSATDLTPRAHAKLEGLLDKVDDHLELRNGLVHGRNGRMALSDVYESHRWVKEKGQPAKEGEGREATSRERFSKVPGVGTQRPGC